jgi:hypothetical protein
MPKGAVAEIGGLVLVDRHELIVLGHVEGVAQGLIDAVENGLAPGVGLA